MTPTSRPLPDASAYKAAPQEIIATAVSPTQVTLEFAEPATATAPRISDQTTNMIVTPQQVISLLAHIQPHPTLEQRDILSEVANARGKLRSRLADLNMRAIGSGSCFGPSQLGNIQRMIQKEAQEYFADCGVAPEILQALFLNFEKPSIEEELFTAALETAYPNLTTPPDAATQQQFIQLVSLLNQWSEASEQEKTTIHQQLTTCIDSITDFSALALCHNYRGTPLFLLAATSGNIPAINQLLEKHPAFIYALTQTGFNSLDIAIDRNSTDMLRTLLEHLNDSAQSNELRNQALKFALKYNHPLAINLLITYGAEIKLQPKEKVILADALNATRKEMKEVLSSLLKQGTYPSFDSGWTKARLPLCMESGLSKKSLLALYDVSSQQRSLFRRNLTSEDRNRLTRILDNDCFSRTSNEQVNTARLDFSEDALTEKNGYRTSQV